MLCKIGNSSTFLSFSEALFWSNESETKVSFGRDVIYILSKDTCYLSAKKENRRTKILGLHALSVRLDKNARASPLYQFVKCVLTMSQLCQRIFSGVRCSRTAPPDNHRVLHACEITRANNIAPNSLSDRNCVKEKKYSSMWIL